MTGRDPLSQHLSNLRPVAAPGTKRAQKRLENRLQDYFVYHNTTTTRPTHTWSMFSRIAWAPLLMTVVLLGGWKHFANPDQVVVAGKINPLQGLVQVVRDGQLLEFYQPSDLLVGDWIQVGERGRAEINLTNEIASTASSGTFVRVADNNKLFLEQGTLDSVSLGQTEISTERGAIVSPAGSEFSVEVSSTGETKVTSAKEQVQVFDLNNGQIPLLAGEALSLKSDTKIISNQESNEPIASTLSSYQLRAIRGKLDVARSKILTAIQNWQDQDVSLAKTTIESARDSYVSVVGSLLNSRQQLIAQRKSFSSLPLSSVLDKMKEKNIPSDLAAEAEALATLLELAPIAFESQPTRITLTSLAAYDRYRLLKTLILFGDESQRAQTRFLLKKYALNFLQPLQSEDLWIERLAKLNNQIDELPNTTEAREFLQLVTESLDRSFSLLVKEKIENKF